MKSQAINYKWTMNKLINETIKRAIRVRLQLVLEDQQKEFRRWEENIRHKLNISRQQQIERKFNKIISALKIVIYWLTPYMERTDDEPTFVVKKKPK